MPTKTFYNLSNQKREFILEKLKSEFTENNIFDANIKDISKKLNISRSSFYQYFDSLEECYFFILQKETIDLHLLFISIFKETKYDLMKSLKLFGEKSANILFDKNLYYIYKNRFLFWNNELDTKWKKYITKNSDNEKSLLDHFDKENLISKEKLLFINSVIHGLIYRNFLENWSKEIFLKQYNLQIKWIEKGIYHYENY